MNREKQLNDSYRIASICFSIFVLLIIFSVLFGCTTELTNPEPEVKTLSGVYQSAPYETHKTFDIKLEILQDGDQLSGTVVKDSEKFNVQGTVRDYIVILDGGFFNMNLAYNETKPFPFAGNCTWNGEQRAIHFSLISKLHNQGGIK